MKCPKCGKDVELQKKQVGVDENGKPIFNEYAICRDCKKQWNLDKQKSKKAANASEHTQSSKPQAVKESAAPVADDGTKAAPAPKKKPADLSAVSAAAGTKPAAPGTKAAPAKPGKPAPKKAPAGKAPAADAKPASGKSTAPGAKTPAAKAPQAKEGVPAAKAPQAKEGVPAAKAPQAKEGTSAPKAPQAKTGAPTAPGKKPASAPSAKPAAPAKKAAPADKTAARTAPDGRPAAKRPAPDGRPVPKKKPVPGSTGPQKSVKPQEEPRYSNIPPEKVRAKREKAVRDSYEDMLAADPGRKPVKKKRPASAEDGMPKKRPASSDTAAPAKRKPASPPVIPEEHEEPKAKFRGIRILFGILSIAAFAFFAYKGFLAGLNNISDGTNATTGTIYIVLALCMLVSGLLLLIMQKKRTIFAFLLPMIVYIGGAVFAFLKRGEDKMLLYGAIVGAALAVIFLILTIASRGGDEEDDFPDDYDDPFEDDYDN